VARGIHRARPLERRRNAQEGILPKILPIERSRKHALLTVAAVSLAMTQWFLASESVPAAPAPDTIIVAQAPPPPPPAPPQPKQQAQPPVPAQPLPKQQAQPQPPVPAQPLPNQQVQPQPPVPAQPLPKQQAQPQPPVPAPPLPNNQQAQPPVPVQPLPKQQAQPQPKQPPQSPPAVVQQPPGQQPAQVFQRVRPAPGQPAQPGQAAPLAQPGQPAQPAVPAFANVQDLRAQRHERTEAGGRIVIEEPDHRMIVREGGQAFVRHDENERLFMFGDGRRERRNDGFYSIIVRPGGDEIITVTDDDGRLIRRYRRDYDGREYILIDNRRPRDVPIFLNLPLPIIGIPREQYIVDTAVAPAPFIYQTLAAPPLVPIERPYSLDEIRYNVALRDRMRRVDVDTINFDLGSWEVSPDQVPRLQLVAQAIQDALARNPNEVFLVEGHTDATGNDTDNLSLSDRRAETVAAILTESFQIPPENLTSQGYGSHYLKVPTPEANRQNRRVTVRRITPLLTGQNG
jgi:outer membrane protein OmpA-like peptidoglycan-associated protein